MVETLMDGRSRTGKELALQAGVSAQTASVHLAKLAAAGLVSCAAEGRCRYYRLAGPDIADAFEALTALAPKPALPPVDDNILGALRLARTCYDHLAGRLGVALTETMIRRRLLVLGGRDFRLTRAGEAFLCALGVNVERARRQRRIFARQCLDWSERRPHLAGALGAALAMRCFELGWLTPVPDARHVVITPHGRVGLARWFNVKGMRPAERAGGVGRAGVGRASGHQS